jgi:voltage-gated potassium channel
MTTPQPPEPQSAAPRRIGLHRFSAAEFLIAVVLLFVVSPFVELIPGGNLIETVLITLVLVMGVLAVGRRRRTLVVAVILALPAFIGKWVNHFRPDLIPTEVFLVTGLLFVIFVLAHLLGFILRAPRVNSEVLCAGISAYLLLGLSWSFAYLLVAQLAPDAFFINNGTTTGHSLHGADAFYFSLITLSTVGYGDIIPVSNVARMLAAMEAITGSLFVAVLIARLVALYSSERLRSGEQKH